MDCPSCMKDVSFFASICPYCNRSVAEEKRPYVLYMGAFPFAFLMAILWLDLELWLEILIGLIAGMVLTLSLHALLEWMEANGKLTFENVFFNCVGVGICGFLLSLYLLDGNPNVWIYMIPSAIWGLLVSVTWCTNLDEEPSAPPPKVAIDKGASGKTFKDRLKNK